MAVSRMGFPARATSWLSSSRQIGEAEDAVIVGGLTAAEDGFGPGHDLDQREGFGHVVVSAHGEAGHPVVHLALGREEEDGHVEPVGPDAAGTSKPSRSGSMTSSTMRSKGVLLGFLQGVAARVGHVDLVALVAQDGGHRVDDRRLRRRRPGFSPSQWVHQPRSASSGVVCSDIVARIPGLWLGVGCEPAENPGHHGHGQGRGSVGLGAASTTW